METEKNRDVMLQDLADVKFELANIIKSTMKDHEDMFRPQVRATMEDINNMKTEILETISSTMKIHLETFKKSIVEGET